MQSGRDQERERLNEYAATYGIEIQGELGFGNQGTVAFTNQNTAAKVFRRESHYLRERDVYRRLLEREVQDIRGCAVPKLFNYNNHLWVVEMSVVKRPCVLDFASAYLDVPPEYPAETVAEQAEKHVELFGARWPEVELILAAFERFGIYLVDVHPGNIRLKSDPSDV